VSGVAAEKRTYNNKKRQIYGNHQVSAVFIGVFAQSGGNHSQCGGLTWWALQNDLAQSGGPGWWSSLVG